MKKPLFIIILFLGISVPAISRHITGGEIYYEWLGPGASSNTSVYKITLRLFRDFFSTGAQLDPSVNISIYEKFNNQPALGSPFPVNLDHIDIIERSGNIPCIVNPPAVRYQVGYYYLTVTLPDIPGGYWISFQRCCRIDNISNFSVPNGIGATYLGSIAGSDQIGFSSHNSSPEFVVRDTALVCHNRPFTLDFSASDPDGDVLTYEFSEAYDGGNMGSPVVVNPPPPPYATVPYGNGYSAFSPLGTATSINANTGIISGMAPASGNYVIAVSVFEWRNGQIINEHRKDFILKVADCDFVAAKLPITSTYCEDFSAYFENQTPSSLIFAWHWNFGVAGTLGDTSNIATPTFTYPDTGVYTVKLVVNPGDQCSDSATMQLGVFPGFFPDFTHSGICVNKPTQFTDATTTVYGSVSGWRWDFGQAAVTNDTSRLKNPVYTYPSVGVKTVQLIVQSTKGCVDTAYKDITIIDKPPITLPFRDTLICSIDSLQLIASGMGVFSWSPNYNIINSNTSTPIVYPKTTTWYTVDLDDNGCKNKDSIRVRVVDRVTLSVSADTTSCEGDPVQLFAFSDGLQYTWSPAGSLNNPALQNPIASPVMTTNYQVISRIGKCSATDNINVRVVPYPFADAGPDTTICYNTSAQLKGQITGSSFFWTPQSSLNNANILNPIAKPTHSTIYILTVRDTIGCPKPGFDTAMVIVLPKVNAFAGRDTAVVVGQLLQFNASGGESYSWSPPTALTNTNIANPIGLYSGSFDSIRYWVTVVDEIGCIDSASMLVKIFKTNPQVFVPTGFTPNGDGRNDAVKPIAVGISKIEYFRIYNRWGQLVFSTTINGHGWDGTIGGKRQGTGTFVWLVKAVDFTGKSVFQKGTVTLIN
jgi:gliding motility-associated-like protein